MGVGDGDGVGVGVGDGSRPGLGDRVGLRAGFGDADLTVVLDVRVALTLGPAARPWITARGPREVCRRPDRACAGAGGLADGAAVTDGTAGASAEVTGAAA